MRYGIVSDIHGNLEALQAVLDALGDVDGLLCPGDAVGYGPNPGECCDLLRSRRCITVLGNHDAAVVGMSDVRQFNPVAQEAVEWTRNVLRDKDIDYLKSLSPVHWGNDFVMVHGSLDNPLRFPYIVSAGPARQCFAEMKDYTVCFIGHTHVAEVYIRQYGKLAVDQMLLTQGGTVELKPGFRYIVNCGSVGQPRDGEKNAACGIYDSEQGTVTVIRVPYDISAVQERMRAARLPEILARRLESGS